jgi:hypothetical protein
LFTFVLVVGVYLTPHHFRRRLVLFTRFHFPTRSGSKYPNKSALNGSFEFSLLFDQWGCLKVKDHHASSIACWVLHLMKNKSAMKEEIGQLLTWNTMTNIPSAIRVIKSPPCLAAPQRFRHGWLFACSPRRPGRLSRDFGNFAKEPSICWKSRIGPLRPDRTQNTFVYFCV